MIAALIKQFCVFVFYAPKVSDEDPKLKGSNDYQKKMLINISISLIPTLEEECYSTGWVVLSPTQSQSWIHLALQVS